MLGYGIRLERLRNWAPATPSHGQLTSCCAPADEGSWVRVRTALYKGDLAKVVDADYSAGKATVKIVPRLDYAAMALRRDEGRAAGQPFGRPAGAVRPPARSAPYMPQDP